MAEKEYLIERIKYLSDLLKLSGVFVLAVGSGTISLLLGELSGKKTILAAIGAGIIIALVAFVLALHGQIQALLEKLKED